MSGKGVIGPAFFKQQLWGWIGAGGKCKYVNTQCVQIRESVPIPKGPTYTYLNTHKNPSIDVFPKNKKQKQNTNVKQ